MNNLKCVGRLCGLLGALLVVESDGCKKEGPAIAFLHTLWVKQCVAEGALQCS